MIQNAVSYYFHLREQGLDTNTAARHAQQRFGVSQADLYERIHGGVADREATRQALAEARAYLTSHDDNGHPEGPILRRLYQAVTGEVLP